MAQTNELAARNAIARELKPSLVSKLYHYSAAQLFEAEGRVRMLMYECALHKPTLCRANTLPSEHQPGGFRGRVRTCE